MLGKRFWLLSIIINLQSYTIRDGDDDDTLTIYMYWCYQLGKRKNFTLPMFYLIDNNPYYRS